MKWWNHRESDDDRRAPPLIARLARNRPSAAGDGLPADTSESPSESISESASGSPSPSASGSGSPSPSASPSAGSESPSASAADCVMRDWMADLPNITGEAVEVFARKADGCLGWLTIRECEESESPSPSA